jgi:hypothetical protein
MNCKICEKSKNTYAYQAINGNVICKDCVLDIVANQNNYQLANA